MTEPQIREALREVIDPELGVNIVDLGLVYGIEIAGDQVRVSMTMTSPACPLGSYLTDIVNEMVRWKVPEVANVEVALVWDPPWTPGMMTAEGKAQLGWSEEPDIPRAPGGAR